MAQTLPVDSSEVETLARSGDKTDAVNPLFGNVGRVSDDQIDKCQKVAILEFTSIRSMILSQHYEVFIDMDKRQFHLFVRPETKVAELLLYVRQQLKLRYWDALYLLVDDKALIGSDLMLEVFHHHAKNNKLYLQGRQENFFG